MKLFLVVILVMFVVFAVGLALAWERSAGAAADRPTRVSVMILWAIVGVLAWTPLIYYHYQLVVKCG